MRGSAIAGAAVLAVTAVMATTGPVRAKQLDMCLSVNGRSIIQRGTATCHSFESDGPANVARAMGAGATATAGMSPGDTGNHATAMGDEAYALASGGARNTATASGVTSRALARSGDGNTATASGDNSYSMASSGSGNTATSIAPFSQAWAFSGNRNTAIAETVSCQAIAFGGNTTATC
jgi:hypothetical protein